MKRIEAPHRIHHQPFPGRVEGEPEISRPRPYWQSASAPDRMAWAEDIWPDCRK